MIMNLIGSSDQTKFVSKKIALFQNLDEKTNFHNMQRIPPIPSLELIRLE